MADQDIPFIDERVSALPADLRADLAERGRRDLYFFAKGILGYKDMTLACHGPLCRFVEVNPAQFKLVLMPRDHFKSSVVTIAGTLQRVVKDKESRNLIRNEIATNASRFLRAIKQHAEGNRIFRALYSELIPKDYRRVRWNDSELDFVRQGQYPEPTISAAGIMSTSTSQHFTSIIDDDPISEEAVKSQLVMEETIARLKGTKDLLVDHEKDPHLLVGTRWTFSDTYSWYEKMYGSSGSFAKFIRAAIEDGQPIFPERFSLPTLAHTATIKGPYLWSCNYMNNPRNPEVQDLNVADLRFWRWNEPGDRVELIGNDGKVMDSWRVDELDVTITVDPAPSETMTSDRNAISVVGVSPRNQLIVLEAWGKRCTSLELVDQLVEYILRYSPRKIGIEKAVYQMSLQWFLKDRAEKKGLYVRVEPLRPGGKGKPHVRGLQPLMATGKLFIHPSQMLLRQEMADYPLGEHDDVVDCLGLQLQLMKGQLSPEYQARLKAEELKIVQSYHRPRPEDQIIRSILDLDPEEEIDLEAAQSLFGSEITEYQA